VSKESFRGETYEGRVGEKTQDKNREGTGFEIIPLRFSSVLVDSGWFPLVDTAKSKL
jgi:hypothetical protein